MTWKVKYYYQFLLIILLGCSLEAKDWGKDIAALEAKAKAAKISEVDYLFVGSSSIRMWDLKKAFPDLSTINHGFGGSELCDSIQYVDRIVIAFKPKVVFLYAGDNDVSKGKKAEVVIEDFQTFASRIRKKLPETTIVFLPIKPSLARWNLWPEMNRANQAIKEFTEKNPFLDYLDTATPMLGRDQKPLENLFLKDGLHLNAAGYAIWNQKLSEWVANQKKPSL
jgi:lysophospholipase L1-like esterase